MQTTTILHSTGEELNGVEAVPQCPLPYATYDEPIRVYKAGGIKITWWKDSVERVQRDEITFNEIKTIWWKKPTIADAIAYSKNNQSGFFQFHKDGSVEAEFWNQTHYWPSEPLSGPEERGEVEVAHWCTDKYNFEEECDGYCVDENGEKNFHSCGYRSCKGDCGVLWCGCIDVCRGRCGTREFDRWR